MRNFLLGIVTVAVLLALVGGAYYFGTQNLTPEQKQDVSVTPTTLTNKPKVKKVIPTNTPSPTLKEELSNVGEQIIASIKSKNTQPFEGYTADTVSVRLEASSCCGQLTKAEAISQLSYLDPANGWDFDPANPILISLAAAVPDYYGNDWTVGVANNEYVFSFKLNNENKMDAYNISATYKLIIP